MGAATAVKEEGTMHTSLYVETKNQPKRARERERECASERESERLCVYVCVCINVVLAVNIAEGGFITDSQRHECDSQRHECVDVCRNLFAAS